MGDWVAATLGDLADLGFGKTPSRADSQYWGHDSGHAWATIADLRHDPVMATAEAVSDAGLPYAGRVVPAGGVMMSFKLTVGRVARAGIDLLTNEAIVSVLGRPCVANDGWLYHALPAIASAGVTDTAVKGVTLNKFKLERLRVDVPPLDEQRRIAEILDTFDDTIRATERLIDKLDTTRSGVLNELTASLGGADEMPLAEAVTDPLCYGIVQVGENVSGGVPVVAIRDLGGTFGSELHRTDPANDARYPRSRIRGGDVLLSIKGTVGRVGLVPPWFRGNISRDVALIRPVSSVMPSFLKLYLESSIGQGRLGRIAVGTTRAELSIHALRRVAIPVPTFAEQERIVGALRALDERLRAEYSEMAKLRDMRVALAADLLSGRVRTVAA